MTTQDQDSKGGNAQDPNSNANNTTAHDQNEVQRLKLENKKLLETTQSLESKINEMNKGFLKEKEDYKSLFEETSNENKILKAEKENLQSSVIYNERFRAVFPEMKKQGLLDQAHKYIEDLSLDDLEVETTSQGRFIVKGAGGWVERFKKENPLLFQTPKPSNINTSGGRATDTQEEEITPSRIYELEQVWKKSGKPEDRKAYESAYFKYAEQRKKS